MPERLSYTRSTRGIAPKPFRPKTLGEARKIIADTFERNRWDEDSQRRYFAMKGVDTTRTVADLTIEEARSIIAAMERSRMVIFFD